jgi:hypothetical protein
MSKIIVKPMVGFVEKMVNFLGWIQRTNTVIGWTSLWDTVYIRPGYYDDKKLLAHECTHIMQMQKLGKFMFMIKYVMEFFKNGYHNNAFEVEARANSNGDIDKFLNSLNIDNRLE